MKLSPIKLNKIDSGNVDKNGRVNTFNKCARLSSDIFFKGTDETEEKINSDIQKISNSKKYKSEMTTLRESSLENRKSLDDFLISSMQTYIKNAITFPIKEDFFEYKAKKRFVEIMKKTLNQEYEDETRNYIKYHYGWGVFIVKFGGWEAFATAVPCVLPYAKGYEIELGMLKLKDMENKEKFLRNRIERQNKIIKAKEQMSDEYLKPCLAVKDDSELKLPNSIMLECNDKKMSEEILKWLLENTISRKIAIGDENDSNSSLKNKVKSALENSKKTYENYKTPTLVYCENFEKLLQSTNPPQEIAAIKSLLTNTYEKYHATIIFSANNSKTIDNVLKQPHRMKQIKVD